MASRYNRRSTPIRQLTASMSHPDVQMLPFPPRPAPAPSHVAGALGAIERVGQALAFASSDGGGLTPDACGSLAEALRGVYRVVRSLRTA